VQEDLIAGTVFSDNSGRILLFDRFRLDMIPEGAYLNFRIIDRPGIVGKIGTILGANKINIAGLSLSRAGTGEELAFVSVDDPISDAVLDEIRKIDGMIEAKVLHL
jgi:D-3-phosphoglycerate dehydrogenase